jgi:hypothetical protein
MAAGAGRGVAQVIVDDLGRGDVEDDDAVPVTREQVTTEQVTTEQVTTEQVTTEPVGARWLDEVLRACAALHDPEADPELEAVKAALLLEDALGVLLTDADIAALESAVPAGPAAVGAVVRQARRVV